MCVCVVLFGLSATIKLSSTPIAAEMLNIQVLACVCVHAHAAYGDWIGGLRTEIHKLIRWH